MIVFKIIIALLLLPAGAHVADKWILLRHKHRWHDLAVRYWYRLDETPVPNLLQTASKRIIRLWNKGLKNPLKAAFWYVMFSIIFIAVAQFLTGIGLAPGSMHWDFQGDFFDRIPLPHVVILVEIVFFDIFTLMITRRALIQLQHCSQVRAFAGLFSHLVFLIALMILCLSVVQYTQDFLVSRDAIGLREVHKLINDDTLRQFKEEIATNESIRAQIGPTTPVGVDVIMINSFAYDVTQNISWVASLLGGPAVERISYQKQLFTGNDGSKFVVNSDSTETINGCFILMSGTLAFPALVISVLLLFLLISKIMLLAMRLGTMYFLELMSEPSPKDIIPFTLLAGAADMVLICLGVIALILHWHFPFEGVNVSDLINK